MATAAEAAEAALPSAGSGSHRAPSAPSDGGAAGAGAGRRARPPLSSERRAALLAGLNQGYSAGVQPGEVDELRALLGDEHIFRISTV